MLDHCDTDACSLSALQWTAKSDLHLFVCFSAELVVLLTRNTASEPRLHKPLVVVERLACDR